MKIRKIIYLLISMQLMVPIGLTAQVVIKNMLIYEKGGKVTSIPVNNIEKIIFDGPNMMHPDPSLKDADGNAYQVVKIGQQVWMSTNLKTTKYNDGTPIRNVKENEVFAKLTEGAYCWYLNKPENKDLYGALYNWYAVNTGKLCPKGWHVPANHELRVLLEYLMPNPGDKLKVAGKTFWKNNMDSANNESGFSALPGGARQLNGTLQFEGAFGQWWSTAPGSSHSGEGMMIYDNSFRVAVQGIYKVGGASVRCIQD